MTNALSLSGSYVIGSTLVTLAQKGHAPEVELDTVRDEIKSFQAKKRLKGAILGVMASNKMKTMMATLSASKKAAAGGGGGAVVVSAPTGKLHLLQSKITL